MDATSDWFPYPYQARLNVELGPQLTVRLQVTNTGTEPFSYEEALHAYLAVGDVRRVLVRGLDGSSYFDKAEGDRVDRQAGDLLLAGPTDRVYRSTGEVLLIDPVFGRSIRVRKEHSAQTVVWNPWQAGAQALVDLGPGDWPHFLCVEPANVQESAVELHGGQAHEMALHLSIEPLP